jgi:hypothetical protein
MTNDELKVILVNICVVFRWAFYDGERFLFKKIGVRWSLRLVSVLATFFLFLGERSLIIVSAPVMGLTIFIGCLVFSLYLLLLVLRSSEPSPTLITAPKPILKTAKAEKRHFGNVLTATTNEIIRVMLLSDLWSPALPEPLPKSQKPLYKLLSTYLAVTPNGLGFRVSFRPSPRHSDADIVNRLDFFASQLRLVSYELVEADRAGLVVVDFYWVAVPTSVIDSGAVPYPAFDWSADE